MGADWRFDIDAADLLQPPYVRGQACAIPIIPAKGHDITVQSILPALYSRTHGSPA
jgi:hypothetical protein